jgi:formylglycine-generating enzyme required for sulfatase activity
MAWSPVGLLVAVGVLCGGCARDSGPQSSKTAGQSPAARFVATDGAATDAATGLPTRVVDRHSGIVLVLIPAGEFEMGSPETEVDRSKPERRHRRMIKRPFYLGETEVTVAQFRKLAEATGYQTDAERGAGDRGRGSFATIPEGDRTWHAGATWRDPFPLLPDVKVRDDHPVIQVSWNDARKFAEHFGMRLPSEAQWEYAARAGSGARYPWGESEAGGAGRANLADLSARRRFRKTNVYFPFDDGVEVLAPVRQYLPNAWGLYDMIGNVEEWCEDAKGVYPADGADESPNEDPATPARVLRGGSWMGNAGTSRSATRIGMAPDSRRDFQGFRVAATVEAVGGD